MHFLTNLQVRQFSGAVVSTKGLFMSEPDKGKVGYVLMLFFSLSSLSILIIIFGNKL